MNFSRCSIKNNITPKNFIKRYLNPQNDVAFKRIFGREKIRTFPCRAQRCSCRANTQTPQKRPFCIPIQKRKAVYEKRSVINVICKDQDDCTSIVEMQVEKDVEFKERA